jgi:hypothetical protein
MIRTESKLACIRSFLSKQHGTSFFFAFFIYFLISLFSKEKWLIFFFSHFHIFYFFKLSLDIWDLCCPSLIFLFFLNHYYIYVVVKYLTTDRVQKEKSNHEEHQKKKTQFGLHTIFIYLFIFSLNWMRHKATKTLANRMTKWAPQRWRTVKSFFFSCRIYGEEICKLLKDNKIEEKKNYKTIELNIGINL